MLRCKYCLEWGAIAVFVWKVYDLSIYFFLGFVFIGNDEINSQYFNIVFYKIFVYDVNIRPSSFYRAIFEENQFMDFVKYINDLEGIYYVFYRAQRMRMAHPVTRLWEKNCNRGSKPRQLETSYIKDSQMTSKNKTFPRIINKKMNTRISSVSRIY